MSEVMDRTCTKCGQCKPLTAFCADNNKTGGRHTHCRECRSAAYKAWRASKSKGAVWSRDGKEVVIDAAFTGWRYPVEGVLMLRIAA